MAESFCTQCFQLLLNNHTSSVSGKRVHGGDGADLGDTDFLPSGSMANRTSDSFGKEVA